MKFAQLFLLAGLAASSTIVLATDKQKKPTSCDSYSIGQPVKVDYDGFVLSGAITGFSKSRREAYVQWTAMPSGRPQYQQEWRNGEISRNASVYCNSLSSN